MSEATDLSERIHPALTVEELIRELQQQNPKSPVYINDTMEYVWRSVTGVTGGATMSCDETKTPIVLIEM